jgi:hypothetical protein
VNLNMPDAIASRLIGSLFVERGLVSESQIRVALDMQRETGAQLGQILVDQFGVSRKELTRIVAEQWREMHGGDPGAGPDASAGETWRPLGEIFVTRGFVSEEELDAALHRQRKTGERLGEALVALGVISKFELAGALGEQMATLEAVDPQSATEATVVELHPPAADDVPPSDEAAESRGTTEGAVHEDADVAQDSEPTLEPELIFEPEPTLEAEPTYEPEPTLEGPSFEPEPTFEAEPTFEIQPQSGEQPAVEDTFDSAPALEQVPAESDGEVSVGLEAVVDDWLAPPVEPEPARYVAYASTPWGYRLVPLDVELPSVGDTIDVAELGPLVVSRVGRSPLPLDTRLCVFAEQVLVSAAP